MSLFFRGQQKRFYDPNSIPLNSQVGRTVAGTQSVTNETAMRASAVWAALRLRANLISTLPVDAYRDRDGVRLEVPRPTTTFINAGRAIEWHEFLYATQMDLDRAGNCFGVITERNALGLPSVIELVNLGDVTVQPRYASAGTFTDLVWRIGGREYDPEDIWHERQYVVPGIPLGLNAIAYAAYSIGSFLSAQDFSLKWFGQDAIPAAVLRNTEAEIPPDVAAMAKSRYQASMTPGGVFVTGANWELSPLNAATESNQYIETMQFGVPDIARFFDVPADTIDGAISGSAVTYANITQRFLQLLVIHLGPAITRRELALSTLLPGGRYVKLNRRAILAMDPLSQAQLLASEITSRITTPDEARALSDKLPLTEADMAQFAKLFGDKNPAPTPKNGAPA